jgi:hypothetical protein
MTSPSESLVSPLGLLGLRPLLSGLTIPLAALTARWGGTGRVFRFATGMLSLGFGIFLMWQIGWKDGLFLAVPQWSPH